MAYNRNTLNSAVKAGAVLNPWLKKYLAANRSFPPFHMVVDMHSSYHFSGAGMKFLQWWLEQVYERRDWHVFGIDEQMDLLSSETYVMQMRGDILRSRMDLWEVRLAWSEDHGLEDNAIFCQWELEKLALAISVGVTVKEIESRPGTRSLLSDLFGDYNPFMLVPFEGEDDSL